MVIEVYLNDVWVDITDNVLDSYSQKTILSIEIPKVSTLSLKLEGDKAFFDALASVHDVRVYDEGKERFGGYTTGNISIDYTKEDILSGSIKYYDYSKKFYNTLEVLHYENVAICNGEGSLLYLLFDELKTACGLDLTLDCSYIDSSIIDDIYVPEGDIYSNFYDFLSYNALTMYVIGKTIYIYDLLSVPTESYILEDVASLRESYSFDRDDSNPLVYASRVITKEDERIFTLNDEDEGEVLINGDSYPVVEDDDDAEYLTCQYDIELEDNEELIAVTDLVTTQVLDYADSIDADIDMGQDSADIKLTNNTGSFVVFNNLYLDATLQIQEYFQSSSLESGATDEVKTVFLRDTDHVTRYLRYVSFINGYNKKYYTFYSDSEMEVGDMVSVRDLTDPLIITQRTDSQDRFGGYDYIATLYQNTVVDAITKKIAVSKYEKGYTGDIYSSDGFVLDGDFETTLTCKVFLNTKEMSPSTYQWIRESGNIDLDNEWKVGKNSKTLDITQEDLRGLGSVQFACKTTYPNFLTDYKQVVDLSKSSTEKLTIEYATSESSTLEGSAQLGTFQGEYFQFKGEDIQVFDGIVWTTEQPTDTDVYVFIRYTDNTTSTQTVSLYSIPLEKSISLVASNNGIFSVTERGVVNNESISITIKPTNFYILDGDVNTTWYYYDSEWLLLTGNESTIAIDYDSFTFPLTVKAVYDLGSETIEDTIELTEITQSVATAHYSVLSTEPTAMGTTAPVGFDEYGTEYIKGDSYVYERTNEDDSVDYIPYVFDGTDWVEITDDNGDVKSQYMAILGYCASSVINDGKDIPVSSSAIYGYFKNLSATNAFITNLVAQDLLLNDGGLIRSKYYNKDGTVNEDSGANSGFYIDSNGNLRAENADFTNTSVSGKFTSDSLETFDGKSDITSEWGLNQAISTDYYDWTYSDVGLYSMYKTLYGNGIFVGMRTYYLFYSTDNGITWSQGFHDSSNQIQDVIYGNGVFVAVSLNNNVLYSTDGMNWTNITVGSDNNWLSIDYGNGTFVAVGNGYKAYSTDGINWTTSSSSYNWNNVAYTNNIFLVTDTDNYKTTSTDGITWSTPTSFALAMSISLLHGLNNVFIARRLSYYSYSIDNGATWSEPKEWIDGENIYDIAYIDDHYIMIGEDGYISYSSNLENWTTPSVLSDSNGSDIRSIGYNDSIILLFLGSFGELLTATREDITLQYDIYDYLSSLLDSLIAPSGETLPTVEPLLYTSYVSGTLTWNGTSYSLEKMKVANNQIIFTDFATSRVIDVYSNSSVYLSITNLIIEGASEENQVSAVTPKNGDRTGYIGTESNAFESSYVENTYNKNIVPKDGADTGTIGTSDRPFAEAFINEITSETPSTFDDGYVIMPNGLIIQWGKTYLSANTRTQYSYPISFTTDASITATGNWDDSDGWATCGADDSSTSKYYLFNTNNNGRTVNWIAIGY